MVVLGVIVVGFMGLRGYPDTARTVVGSLFYGRRG